MALDEVTFYNTNGDEISISNIVNQMINYYLDKREIGETQITDFNEGSEIRNLLEAFAVGIYALLEEQHEATRIAFISTSEGIWLDKIGELPFINLTREIGKEAEGFVRFSIEETSDEDIIIPAETFLSTEDEIEFITDFDCTIYAGETNTTVSASALLEGSDGNVGAGEITIINSSDINTEKISVINDDMFINGTDNEDDELYRARLLANVQSDGFGTVGWYRKICESVKGVHDVKFVSTNNYTRKCLVNGYNKPVEDLVLLNVLSELTDLNNLVLGHSFIVDRPDYTYFDLVITIDTHRIFDTGYLSDLMQIFMNGGNFNSLIFDGVDIGESIPSTLIKSTLLIVEDIINVSSIKMNNIEVDNISPESTHHVLKLNNVTFIQNEV